MFLSQFVIFSKHSDCQLGSQQVFSQTKQVKVRSMAVQQVEQEEVVVLGREVVDVKASRLLVPTEHATRMQ